MTDQVLADLHDAIVDGDADWTTEVVTDGLAAGVPPTRLLFEAMIPALEDVGARFEAGEIFLPEMLVAARAMQQGMNLIRPLIVRAGVDKLGRVLLATVAGDIHDVGKNLVSVMLEGAGFEVIDLGINVPGQAIVDAIRELHPDVVGMSAFLTTTLPELRNNVILIEEAGLRDDVKIIIGGAPVNEHTVQDAGADDFAPDASAAVRTTKALLGI